MTTVPLGVGAYQRDYAQGPEIRLINRFFEQSPVNQVEGSVLLARPGSKLLTGAGNGPIRRIVTQPGVFDGDMFFVSGDALFRYSASGVITPINGLIEGNGTPAVTFVAGPGYQHLFIADGVTLQYYDGQAAATGTLTATGAIADTDTVEIDNVYYAWTAGSVDAGSPAGTLANPWLVNLGANTEASLTNIFQAINGTGIAGTTYSTALTPHLTVEAVSSTASTLFVRARERGAAGNTITTTETGANIAWAAATLEGGGAQALNGVPTPDDVGVVSLATLASFVLVAVAQSQRFYWIRPGEVVIDPLDFAEAESEPDQLIELLRVGDAVYMFGQSSTEVWYASGNEAAPFFPQQGLAFSQGAIEGTSVQIRTQVITVAEDGKVYQIAGGPQRISDNGIEERIRKALLALP